MSERSGILIRDFTQGNIRSQLIRFSLPLFFSNLLQAVYNMVDMIVVGNVIGETGLSSVSVGGDVLNVVTFIAMGFSTAGQVIIAQYIGAGQKEKLGRFIFNLCIVLAVPAALFMVFGLAFRYGILQLLNAPPQAWQGALYYSVTCLCGIFFIYGYNAVSAILRGMGDSRHPFLFVSIAAVMNIVLDILFVAKLGMGAFGAALATVAGQAFSFLCGIVFLMRSRDRFGFTMDRSCLKADGVMISTLLRLGIPMAVKSACIQISKLFVNSSVNAFGVTVSAVSGIGHKISTVGQLVSNSVTYSGATMVGQNIGAQKYDRVKGVCLNVLLTVSAVNAVLIVLLLLFPTEFFRLFLTDGTPELMAVAAQFVPVGCIVLTGFALRAPFNALVNGSGNHRINFLIALFDGLIVRVGLAFLLGNTLRMGYRGFWLGDAFSGFVPVVIGGIYILSGKWKTNRYVIRGGKD